MKERVERVEAANKVSAVRPLVFLDNQTYQSKPKKKRINKPNQDKEKMENNRCRMDKDHIDCNV